MQLKSHDHLLIKIFESICEGYDSAAILDRKGQVFHLKYETLADLGTLSPAAQTALKYFPLAMGDLVILNDPYSGGTVLSTVSLVTALNDNLILIARQGFRPRLSFAQKLDEEGLRIPPTPLATNRHIALPILEAMSDHPLAPESFKGRLQHFCDKVFATVQKFTHIDSLHGGLLQPAQLEAHLERTRKRMLEILGDEAQGEARTDSELSSGELVKVHLELHAEGIKVNFSGTKTSRRMCLTDSATFGAVLGALLAFLQKPIPINTGLLSLIQVESPLGCFLNAKYPSPTFLGMTEGTSFVAQTVLRALKALSPKNEVAEPATLPLMLNFDFGQGRSFFENLPGGSGATSQQEGCDAVHFWVRNRLEPSVEEIERRFPILIRKFGVHAKSGGQGHLRGGHGMTKEYELLAPATLSYLCAQEKMARRGLKGGQEGLAAEIYMITAKGEKKLISQPQGQLELSPGDKIFVNSSGGGGYGRPLNS